MAAGESVILVDADAANDAGLPNGPVTKLSVAPNGQFVAAFTGEGRLVVWTADFGKFLSEFATQSDTPPEQVAWCGTDSVVLYWEVGELSLRLFSLSGSINLPQLRQSAPPIGGTLILHLFY